MGKVRLPKGTVLKPNHFMIYLLGRGKARLYQQYQMQPGVIQSCLEEKVFSVSGHTWMSLCKIEVFLLIFLYVLWFDTVYVLLLSMGAVKRVSFCLRKADRSLFCYFLCIFDFNFSFFGSCGILKLRIYGQHLVTFAIRVSGCLEHVFNAQIMKKSDRLLRAQPISKQYLCHLFGLGGSLHEYLNIRRIYICVCADNFRISELQNRYKKTTKNGSNCNAQYG